MEVIEIDSSPEDEKTFACNVKRLSCNDLRNFRFHQNINLQSRHYFHIEPNTFDNFPNLVSIDFSYNSIHSLPANLFRNCFALKILKLDSNKIAVIPYKDLANISKLEELSLMKNLITSIDLPYFQSDTLKVLNLSHNYLEKIDKQSFANLRELKDLDLSWNMIYSLDNLVFALNYKLELLFLNNNQLDELSEFQFMYIPFLRVINLQSNRLTRLDTKLFCFNKSLNSLNLDKNLLTLPKTFKFKRNVSLVYLNLNLLTILDFQILKGLNHLESVTFKIDANEIFHLNTSNLDEFLSEQLNLKEFKLVAKFLELGSHEIFRLSSNATKLHVESLNPLQKETDHFRFIKQLNSTPQLKSLVMAGLNNLLILDFNFSFLPNSFKINLENLNCSGSRFCLGSRIIDPKFRPLKHLNLSFCSLNLDLSYAFSNLINLEVLNLEGTKFERITFQLFFFNRQLKYLNLENCQIKIVQDSSFVNLTKLKCLNLKVNPIRNLSPKTFLGLREIGTDILLDPFHKWTKNNWNLIDNTDKVISID